MGFRGSREYWERRYQLGGDSGAGSYGEFARYKADVLNAFVEEHAVADVIEFGCGDGHQLGLAEYPAYLGVDVSMHAVDRCRKMFATDRSKQFVHLDDYRGERGDLALSLDVLFHLVEDEVYDRYLDTLFAAAGRFVIIYTTSTPETPRSMAHVRHRMVESDVADRFPAFSRMVEEARIPPPVHVKGGLSTRFFMYEAIEPR